MGELVLQLTSARLLEITGCDSNNMDVLFHRLLKDGGNPAGPNGNEHQINRLRDIDQSPIRLQPLHVVFVVVHGKQLAGISVPPEPLNDLETNLAGIVRRTHNGDRSGFECVPERFYYIFARFVDSHLGSSPWQEYVLPRRRSYPSRQNIH